MSPEIQAKLAEINRRRREEEARRAAEKAEAAGKKDESLEAICARLEQHSAECRDFEKLHREWAVTLPQSIECPLHKIPREINWDKSLKRSWDANEMKVIYKPCPKCQQAMTATEKNKWLKRCGIPDNLLHAEFGNFEAKMHEDTVVVDVAQKFVRARAGFLIMLSEIDRLGNGKSHLAVSIIRESRGGLFITAMDFLNRCHGSFDAREAIIRRCKETKLLCVDEFGLTPGYRDEMPMFHDVLSHRHSERLKTVITGNFASRKEFMAAIGQRMESRLAESGFKLLWFVGPTRRPEMKQAYFLDEEEDAPENPNQKEP